MNVAISLQCLEISGINLFIRFVTVANTNGKLGYLDLNVQSAEARILATYPANLLGLSSTYKRRHLVAVFLRR